MHSPWAESQRAGRVLQDRRTLVTCAALVFVLLIGVELLSARALTETRRSTSDLQNRTFQVTTLADMVREANKLGRVVERLGEGTTMAEADLQRSILVSQMKRFEAREDDRRLLWQAENVRERLADLDALLADLDPADIGPAEQAAVQTAVDELEVNAKWLYDAAEVPYFASIEAALDDRSDSSTLLLVSTGLVGLFGILYVVVSRRAAQIERTEADDALRRSEERHRDILNSVKEVIFTTDAAGRWTFLSDAWLDLTGASTLSSLGRPFLDWVHPDDLDKCRAEFAELSVAPRAEARHETRYVRANGSVIWVEIWVQRTEDGGTTGTIFDITQRRIAEERLHHQANHDPLTGLANRDLLSRRIENVIADAEARHENAAILFLDLDRFKFVNDSLGHDVGDMLLCEVADRIDAELRPGDTAARLGGDEFVIVAAGLSSGPDRAINEARALSDRLEHAISQPFELRGRRVHISTSVGLTLVRAVSRVDTLISEADAAMYRAKDLGKARHQVFDDNLRAEADQRLHLESELRDALHDQEFVLHYQPIVDTATGQVRNVEALLRWDHPTRGMLTPRSFLEAAEDAGLMPAIGAWVVQAACADAASWRSVRGVDPNLAISVNLSARELSTPAVVTNIADALRDHDLPPNALCIEVTEHQLIDGDEAALTNLRGIHALGVPIALDDFGTGYSSLAYLRQLPISMLKIDRVFVDKLGLDRTDDTIVQVIVELARALGLTTVAEGVELPTQLRRLRELDVDHVQGYLLGQPTSASDLLDVLIPAEGELVN